MVRDFSRVIFGFDVLPDTRLPVRQPLAGGASKGEFGALYIVDAELGTVAAAKIKFGELAVQMVLAAVLINALHAAFE
jgi:hypothetical protein